MKKTNPTDSVVETASHAISRREILATSLAIGAISLTTVPYMSGTASAAPLERGQAPMLDELVKQGKLPPVKDRLPANPYVEKLVDGVGKYGGTLRSAVLAASDQYNLNRTLANELLVRWSDDWNSIVPSLAEEIHVSPDATEFTFKLRKGTRWSDGAPFTADDIMFWYEDVFMSADLTPSKNTVYVVEGKPVTVSKIDDRTVKFKFSSPYGLFLMQMSYTFGCLPTMYPKHYLKQFHPKYNASGIPALLAQSNSAKDWVALFNSKVAPPMFPIYWQNLELPTLNPWILTVPYGAGDRVVAQRNPYYWKVDTAGNQLPYIDRVNFVRLDDTQLMLLKATNGEFDFIYRHINTVENRPVLQEAANRAGYKFFSINSATSNLASLFLNLNSSDPVKRTIFQNKEFRVALSIAINRQEIIDLVFSGQATPAQVAPKPGMDFYNERLATQFTKYDPEAAKKILDKIGLEKRDAAGYRLMPDGRRLSVIFLVADVLGGRFPDVLELVQRDAKAVGIDIQIRSTDRARLLNVIAAGEQDAYIFTCAGGLSDAYSFVFCYMPYQNPDFIFANKWAAWYTDPKQGEEPPADVKLQMSKYNLVSAAADDQRRVAAMNDFLNTTADQFYIIGIARPADDFAYGLVSKKLKNVFSTMPQSGLLQTPAPLMTQFYFSS